MKRILLWIAFGLVVLLGLMAAWRMICVGSLDPIVVKKYNRNIKTSYGDLLKVSYEQHNFPDSSSSTELINRKNGQYIYFCDDPAEERTSIEECYSDGNYNVYFFHESFIFVNDSEMIKLPKEELFFNCKNNYDNHKTLIKKLILDGDEGITCLYSEYYLNEKDEDVKKRIYTVASISDDEDPTYYNHISEKRFKSYNHSQHSCEDVISFARDMVEKYNIEGAKYAY